MFFSKRFFDPKKNLFETCFYIIDIRLFYTINEQRVFLIFLSKVMFVFYLKFFSQPVASIDRSALVPCRQVGEEARVLLDVCQGYVVGGATALPSVVKRCSAVHHNPRERRVSIVFSFDSSGKYVQKRGPFQESSVSRVFRFIFRLIIRTGIFCKRGVRVKEEAGARAPGGGNERQNN